MTARPILFSAPMVRAILAGTKTQTRRVVKPQPTRSLPRIEEVRPGLEVEIPLGWQWRDDSFIADSAGGFGALSSLQDACPYGRVGDRLWVKETHALLTIAEGRNDVSLCAYRATCRGDTFDYSGSDGVAAIKIARWKPSIFMRRHLSRITLEVTGVRVERLQDISGHDAIAEGIVIPRCGCEVCSRTAEMCPADQSSAIVAYAELWDSLNRKRPGCSWAENPWVWCVEFRRLP